MLNLITGKQRSGKSYFCVTLILDYLRTSNRPIYTNLPIHPDFICKHLTRSPAKYSAYLDRLYIFRSFRTFHELREFYKKNPDFCKKRHILPIDNVSSYWTYTKPNCIIFLDEIYQWFSAQGFRDKGSVERRQQLLTYTRQHGHYKDDMFLVSHQSNDVDVNIRRGVQYLYTLENAKYKNIFSWLWLRGLKYPVQFFFVKGYEYGDKDYSDSWTIWPHRYIFQCYDSFSQAESIPGKALPDQSAESTDTGVKFWRNTISFVRQSWIGLLVVIFGVLLARSLYHGYLGMVDSSSKTVIGKTSVSVPASGVGGVPVSSFPTGSPSGGVVVTIEDFSMPVAVSSSLVIFADGFKIRKGDFYNGRKVCSISKSSISVVTDSGDVASLPVSRLYKCRQVSGTVSGSNSSPVGGASFNNRGGATISR